MGSRSCTCTEEGGRDGRGEREGEKGGRESRAVEKAVIGVRDEGRLPDKHPPSCSPLIVVAMSLHHVEAMPSEDML